MNNKSNNLKDIEIAIDKTLTILENNFRYNYGKKIPFEDIFEMIKDLKILLSNYEVEVKKCGKIVIERLIPLLDLLVKVDTNTNHLIEYSYI